MVNGGIWRPATLQRVEPGQAPRGRRVFQAQHQRADEPAAAADCAAGHRHAMPMLPASASAARPAAPKSPVSAAIAGPRWFPPSPPSFRWIARALWCSSCSTNRRVPLPAASSARRHGTLRPIVKRLVPRIGPLLGVMPDATRDIDLSDLRPLVGGATNAAGRPRCADGHRARRGGIGAGVRALPSIIARWPRAMCSARFRGAAVNGEDFIPAAIAAGAVAVVARPEAQVAGALHHRRRRIRAAPLPGWRRDSSARCPPPSSR